MAFDAALNFRSTAAYVADGAGETYCLGDPYTGSVIRGGLTFGWTIANGTSGGTVSGKRDRNASAPYVPELSGVNYFDNNSSNRLYFRVSLPAPGDYDVTVALGDAGATGTQHAWVFDGNQSPGWSTPLWTVASGVATTTGQFVDINGTVRSASQWQAERTAKRLTFTTSILYLAIGAGNPAAPVAATTLAHLRVVQFTGSPPATPTLTVGGVAATQADLSGSAFSDADAGDTHAASQWQVTTTADTGFASPAVDTGDDATHLTSYQATGLSPSTGYLCRVRYKDSSGSYSAWSAAGSFTTASTPAAITIAGNATASRTSGPAPLSVFLDAQSVAGLVEEQVQDAEFLWDLGDPNAGTFATTGYDANRKTGFYVAHLYEQPGTYNVSLAVRTADGQSDSAAVATIVVTDGPWTTYYVSSSKGDDANDGLTAASPVATLAKAVSLLGTGVRVLLRRGDAWEGVDRLTIASVAGPAQLGAYADDGTTDRPVLRSPQGPGTGSYMPILQVNSCTDLRVTGLKLVGNFGNAGVDTTAQTFRAILTSASPYLMVHDCEFRSTADCIHVTAQHQMLDSCLCADGKDYPCYGNTMQDFAYTRNRVVNLSGGQHCIRVQGGNNVYVSGNRHEEQIGSVDCFAFRGDLTGVVATDNRAAKNLHFSPQNATSAEYQRRGLVERCVLAGGAKVVGASDIAIRQNVLVGLSIAPHELIGDPTNIAAYNNAGVEQSTSRFGPDPSSYGLDWLAANAIRMHDNLVYIRTGTAVSIGWTWPDGTTGSPTYKNYAYDERNPTTADPSLLGTDPAGADAFVPTDDSPLVGYGTATHLSLDGVGRSRTGYATTVGAFVPTGAAPPPDPDPGPGPTGSARRFPRFLPRRTRGPWSR